jgi:hypothetical protein
MQSRNKDKFLGSKFRGSMLVSSLCHAGWHRSAEAAADLQTRAPCSDDTWNLTDVWDSTVGFTQRHKQTYHLRAVSTTPWYWFSFGWLKTTFLFGQWLAYGWSYTMKVGVERVGRPNLRLKHLAFQGHLQSWIALVLICETGTPWLGSFRSESFAIFLRMKNPKIIQVHPILLVSKWLVIVSKH